MQINFYIIKEVLNESIEEHNNFRLPLWWLIEIHVVKPVQIARIYENFLCDTT